jgi:hypothetical protein
MVRGKRRRRNAEESPVEGPLTDDGIVMAGLDPAIYELAGTWMRGSGRRMTHIKRRDSPRP